MRALFALSDKTLITPTSYGHVSRFSISDNPVATFPEYTEKRVKFAISDKTIISPTASTTVKAMFAISDIPMTEAQLPAYREKRVFFTVSDKTVITPTSYGHVARFAISDMFLLSQEPSDNGGTGFVIADMNNITVPSPELFKIWDVYKEDWVHAPRYVWNQETKEWRQLS